MKRILFIGGLTSGGAEHQMVVVATLLKKDGYDVTYLCVDNCDFYRDTLEKEGVPVLYVKENKITSLLKLNIPRVTLLLYGFLKKGKYDTVISFLGLWNYENCLFAKRKKTKHRAITGLRNNRDSVFLDARYKNYVKYEKYADVKVCNSDNAKRVFAKHFPEHADKLTTIYNIVDLPAITTTYGIKRDGKLHIIIPASYRIVKNPMNLLKALALLSLEEKQKVLVEWYGKISSGQECYNEMKAFISDNNLENVIKLFDATTDIANRINEADVVGLFSSSEGLPNSICEGMMLSKPIVMTKVSDYDVLVDENNGFLCDWDNPESIKEALLDISKLSNDGLIKMGCYSKQKAETLFSKEAILKQWKNII